MILMTEIKEENERRKGRLEQPALEVNQLDSEELANSGSDVYKFDVIEVANVYT